MKAGIHPAYEEVNVICACGHTFKTRSAHKGDIRVEICSSCHPFFTGKQKLIDTEGRVDRFQKKYQKVKDAAEAKKVADDAKKKKPDAVAVAQRRIRLRCRGQDSAGRRSVSAALALFEHLLVLGLLLGHQHRADFVPLIFG